MIHHRSTVTRKGQVTIPKEFRDDFGIAEGDKVEWSREDGKIILQPAGSIVERTFGVFRHLAEPINRGKSIEQIIADEKEAAAQGWVDSFLLKENRD